MLAQFCEGAEWDKTGWTSAQMESLHTFTVAYVTEGLSDITGYPNVLQARNLRRPSRERREVVHRDVKANATAAVRANTCHQRHINLLAAALLSYSQRPRPPSNLRYKSSL
jgi:hypothetical protein